MKKILFISPGPANHLNRIRALNILKALKEKAEIHFVCLNAGKKDSEYIEKHAQLYKETKVFAQPKWLSYSQCLLGMLKHNSLRLSYCSNRGLHDYLSQIDSESYDIIFISTLRMAQYAKYFPPEKIWIDLTDSMSLYYSRLSDVKISLRDRLVTMYERGIFSVFEKEVLKKYKTIYCSKVDQAYAQSLELGDNQVSLVIPNVVDLDDFPYSEQSESTPEFKMCYWGMLDAPFNYTAVDILVNQIFPKLPEPASNFRLGIIGPNASEELLKKQSEFITFFGYVPNLVKKLNEFDLFVCPLILGTGVKNKILQSLACGLPVLTTSIGAEGIEGIEKLVEKKMVIIEDDLSLYPDIIDDLRKNSRKINNREMRNFIEQHYSINALSDDLAKKGFM
ncbi:glycosyltransferase family 4 protein [Candidatus Latescibacterota bacterium]